MANEAAAKQEIVRVEKFINQAQNNIVSRLPKGVDPDRFVLGLMTAIQKSKLYAKDGKSLQDCDPQNVLLAAYEAAEAGCPLNPSLQLGWLIPYGADCNFQPSYRFFIQRAYETKEVKRFFAEVVYKGDKFSRQFAPDRTLIHMPGDGERVLANRLGAYAYIEFNDGVVDFEYLTNEQIDRHRKASKQQNSMKWVEFWEEGWRITPIRVLAKRLPLRTRQMEDLVELVNRDTERDLVIPIDEIAEPTLPRRASEAPKPATQEAAKSETAKPAQSESQETAKAETAKPAEGASQAGMFPDAQSGDAAISTEAIQAFWKKAMEAGWKRNEVQKYIETTFKKSSMKELTGTELQKLYQVVESGTGQ